MCTDGEYFAQNKLTGSWSEGSVNPVYECIIGKPLPGREAPSDYPKANLVFGLFTFVYIRGWRLFNELLTQEMRMLLKNNRKHLAADERG